MHKEPTPAKGCVDPRPPSAPILFFQRLASHRKPSNLHNSAQPTRTAKGCSGKVRKICTNPPKRAYRRKSSSVGSNFVFSKAAQPSKALKSAQICPIG
jgi:hypothetical protein